MLWYLYIAEARTGNYYVGISTEPERRIVDHNKGRGARMAISQGPFELIYTSPAFADQSSARKWEIRLKHWKRKKKEKLVYGELKWSELVLSDMKK